MQGYAVVFSPVLKHLNVSETTMDAALKTTILPFLVRGWRPYAVLAFLCLLTYLPGLSQIPPLDRDESRFAQASVQMLETGDLLRIKYQETERNKKPAGPYWLQAASAALFKDVSAGERAIWAHRLPSALAATGSVLLTFYIGCLLVGRSAAFLGASLFAVTIMLSLEAHQAKADALLLLFILAAQAALAKLYMHSRAEQPSLPPDRAWIGFWVAVAAGVLVKGPIILISVGLTIAVLAVWDRNWRWLGRLRPLKGVGLTLLLVAPWAVGIGIVTEGRFFIEAIGHDMLGKLAAGQESHGAPPGYYLALYPLTGWPMAVPAFAALYLAWRERNNNATRFLIAWIVPFWLVFEGVATKLPHYVLPTYPALALLVGVALLKAPELLTLRAVRAWASLTCFIAAVLALAGMVLPFIYGSGADPLAFLLGLVSIGLIGAALYFLWQGAAITGWLFNGLAALVLLTTTYQGVLPKLEDFNVSGRLAEQVRAITPDRVAAVGYHEPSLVFYLGTDTLLANGPEAAQALTEGQVNLVAVESRSQDSFLTALKTLSATAIAETDMVGFNYSKGQSVHLTLWRLAP